MGGRRLNRAAQSGFRGLSGRAGAKVAKAAPLRVMVTSPRPQNDFASPAHLPVEVLESLFS